MGGRLLAPAGRPTMPCTRLPAPGSRLPARTPAVPLPPCPAVLILLFATSSIIQIVERMPFHQALYLVSGVGALLRWGRAVLRCAVLWQGALLYR